MTDDTLTTDLRGNRREAASDSSNQLTQDELECRAIEVPRLHHEPDSNCMNQYSSDTDPFVSVRPLGERARDDRSHASREDVRLTIAIRSQRL